MLQLETGFAALALLALFASSSQSAEPTAVDLDTVLVRARCLDIGTTRVVPSREDLNRSLERLGLVMVRRGVSLTGDVHADGFRRGDLAVVVDHERYHCACPNRMDPPTSLALPVEIASATWDRSSSSTTSGLAGELALQRRVPEQRASLRAGIEGDLMESHEGTATASFERSGQRLATRWTGGRSYRDGSGASFGDRYGYRSEDVEFSQADLSWHGTMAGWTGHAQGSLTRDVPYAYLLMDERVNEMWNASIERKGGKLYVTRARHLMDNGLRKSTMGMSTAADQVTIGASGAVRGWELESYTRFWNANNTIATAMSRVQNHLMPRYRQWSAGAARAGRTSGLRWHARLAVTQAWMGDRTQLGVYRALDADAPSEAWFFPFAAGADRTFAYGPGWSGGISAEVASEAPSAEQLFITVRRPMMMGTKKPDWTGAPALLAPVRLTLRSEAASPLGRIELGGSFVENYVLPVARKVGANSVMTYENASIALATTRADGHLAMLEWAATYTLGWNLDGDRPLAEVAPFTASLTARPAVHGSLRGLVRIETAAAQARLDTRLGETRTPAWGRLDLGLDWAASAHVRAAIEMDNVTDALYSNHLAFTRDPFAAGIRVQEPGRSIRALVTFGN